MRVAIISHVAGLGGGAERILLDLVTGLKREGIECTVYIPWTPYHGKDLEWELGKAQINFAYVPFYWWCSNRFLSLIFSLIGFILNVLFIPLFTYKMAEQRPDIVITNTSTSPSGAVVAKLLRIPHIWYVQEFGAEDHRFRYLLGEKRTIRIIDKLSSVIAFPSYAVLNKYARYVDKKKLSVLYQSIVEQYSAEKMEATDRLNIFKTKDTLHLAIVGSVKIGKGQMDAVKALNKLLKDGYKAELAIIGGCDKNYLKSLKQIIDKYGINDKIIFTGAMKHPCNATWDVDVSLICSKNEALGRVLLESMFDGIPVVAAKSGGIPEIIEDGVTGLLYDPGDYQMLSRQIERIADDQQLKERLSRSGKEKIMQTFANKNFIEHALELIDTVVQRVHSGK